MPPAVKLPSLPETSSSTPECRALWTQLSVKPLQLMRLKYDINELFKAGTIVILSEQLWGGYSSPSRYDGQEESNKDNTTSVRIYTWAKKVTTNYIDTDDRCMVLHAHLIDPLSGQVGLQMWHEYARVKVSNTSNSVNYMAKQTPHRGPGSKSFPITDKLVGVVVKTLTPSGRTPTSKILSSTWTYTVRFTLETTEYVWLPCKDAVLVSLLEPLKDSEETKERLRISQTKPGDKTHKLLSYTDTPSTTYYVGK
ncbi:hypothetical protein L227DRAFT_601133 [Lentinus tigrinus ALCF2SS1-6]|uniref:Uncharacterized protein n=1 Tax=Lentinus tigrinus ALCF2SS1-6 TaxID=1328759 RepID=A0A5C2S7E9_9APHY|nr:hypothetical protein L227DRAFT_601133 [Lentinus tigrinus ALCF2SS1-6]